MRTPCRSVHERFYFLLVEFGDFLIGHEEIGLALGDGIFKELIDCRDLLAIDFGGRFERIVLLT